MLLKIKLLAQQHPLLEPRPQHTHAVKGSPGHSEAQHSNTGILKNAGLII